MDSKVWYVIESSPKGVDDYREIDMKSESLTSAVDQLVRCVKGFRNNKGEVEYRIIIYAGDAPCEVREDPPSKACGYQTQQVCPLPAGHNGQHSWAPYRAGVNEWKC